MPVDLGRRIGKLAVQLRDQRVFPGLDGLKRLRMLIDMPQ